MKHFAWVLVVLLLLAAANAAPVPSDQAQVAAKNAAESVWGPLNTLESTALLKPDGTVSAYGFVFGRNGVQAVNESIIADGYNLRQAGSVAEGWEVARAAESYAYVVVAVDGDYGPVLEMCDGLPAYMIFRYDVEAMGAEALGTQNVAIGAIYYLAALEYWYEVTDGQTSVVVNPRRQMTVSPASFATFGSLYDFPGNVTAPTYWNLLLSSLPPGLDDSGYIADVPNYNQQDTDCGPHSAAQTVGYWDDHTYGGEGPWDLLIDTDFWALRDEMRLAMGWVPGGGVTDPQIRDGILAVCNDPAFNNNYSFDAILYENPTYANVTTAVSAGRPGEITTWNHPVYGNHAMTFVGFNDTPSQMVQVHDNWPPNTDEPWIAWDATIDGIIDVFPGGGGPVTPITISSFTGNFRDGCIELSWTAASQADCYGYNILRSQGGEFAPVNDNPVLSMGNPAETCTYHFTDVSVSAGHTYTYALQSLFVDGRTEIADQIEVKALSYKLAQNTPNPFNPSTTIRYEVPQAGFVTLTVFDVMGHRVATLVKENQEANSYTITFDGSGLSSGIYFYTLEAGEYKSIRKMVLLK